MREKIWDCGVWLTVGARCALSPVAVAPRSRAQLAVCRPAGGGIGRCTSSGGSVETKGGVGGLGAGGGERAEGLTILRAARRSHNSPRFFLAPRWACHQRDDSEPIEKRVGATRAERRVGRGRKRIGSERKGKLEAETAAVVVVVEQKVGWCGKRETTGGSKRGESRCACKCPADDCPRGRRINRDKKFAVMATKKNKDACRLKYQHSTVYSVQQSKRASCIVLVDEPKPNGVALGGLGTGGRTLCPARPDPGTNWRMNANHFGEPLRATNSSRRQPTLIDGDREVQITTADNGMLRLLEQAFLRRTVAWVACPWSRDAACTYVDQSQVSAFRLKQPRSTVSCKIEDG